ncbi:MAG: hypothetical protein R3A78_00910 [Polyangiales bacterium]
MVLRAREVPAEVEDDTERQRRELGGAKTLEMELEGDDDIARANTVELDMNERPTQSPPSDEPEAGASATAESSDSEAASEASPGRKPGARAKGGRRAKSERSPRKKKS